MRLCWILLLYRLELCTSPFRFYYNYKHPEEEHPLVALIRGNEQSRNCLKQGIVYLSGEAFELQVNPFPAADKVKQGSFSTPIALKGLPGGVSDYKKSSSATATSLPKEDPWPAEWPRWSIDVD